MPQQKVRKKNPQVSDNLQAISKLQCYLEDIWIKPRIFVLDFQRHLKCTLKYKRRNGNTFIRNYCFWNRNALHKFIEIWWIISVAVLDCLHLVIFHYYQSTFSTTRASTVDEPFVSSSTDNFFQSRLGWHSSMNDSICWYIRSTIAWAKLAGKL